jgi:hypothetical protein
MRPSSYAFADNVIVTESACFVLGLIRQRLVVVVSLSLQFICFRLTVAAFSVSEADSNPLHSVWTSKGVSLSAPSGDEPSEDSPPPMKYSPSVTESDIKSTSSTSTEPTPQSSTSPDDSPPSNIMEGRPFDDNSAPMKHPPPGIESPSDSSTSPTLSAPLPDDSSLPSDMLPGDVPTSDNTPSDDSVDEMIPTLPYLNSGALNSSAPTATVVLPQTSLPPYISGNATNTTNPINAVGTVGVVIGSGSSTMTAQIQGWNTTSTAASSAVVTTTIPIPSDRIPTASLVAPPVAPAASTVSAVGGSWSFAVDFALLGLLAVGAVFVTL